MMAKSKDKISDIKLLIEKKVKRLDKLDRKIDKLLENEEALSSYFQKV